MKKIINLVIALLFCNVFIFGQALTGTKTIKTSGGDYTTIASAISDLNTNGVGSGGVIFNIDSNFTETAANLIITATGTSSNPIIFQKVGTGTNPTITAGTGTSTTVDGIIKLSGTDYITFKGINLQENSSNTTATTQMEWGYAILKASVSDGCKNVTIRNCKVTLNKANTASVGIYINNHTTSSTTSLTVADTNGLNSYCKIYSDSITNAYIGIYINGYGASSPYTLYDQYNRIGADGANSITNFGGGSSTVYGIYAIYQNNLKVAYNNINGGTSTSTTLYGIFLSTGTSSNIDLYNNTITLASSATSSQMAGIYNSMGSTANGNTVNIYNNTFQNSNYSTSTSATMYCIYNGASATTVNIYNNTVSGNTLAGTSTLYGIYTGSPTNLNVYNNTITNNQKSGTSGIMYCVYASTATVNFYGNNINSNSIAGGSSTLYGYYNYGVPSYEALYSNRIYNLTHSGTGTVYGIYTNTTSSATIKIYSDSIYGLSSAGGTIYGIGAYTGTDIRIYKNILFNLSSSTTASIVYGIYVSSGTNIYVYNNFLSELKAPASTNVNAINGIYISGGTYAGLYYNSVYLNSSSSGTNFGSSGVYASSTPTVDLRNNIIVNNSTPAGTGYNVAFRRSSTTLTSYSSLSNNNCFYAGTPSAKKVIFYDGTNFDSTFTQYQNRVNTRDNFSFTENPPFTNVSSSPYNLHLTTSTATQCESGGSAITSPIAITDDFDVQTRSTSYPDVGADEGTFTINDVRGPAISYTPLSNTPNTTSRTLTATITDPSNVPTSGSGLPVLFWKQNRTGSWSSNTATSIGSGNYTFTFGGSVSTGDSIFYYIVAQDGASTPNISCSPSAGSGSLTSSPPAAGTPPTTPNVYKILPSIAGGTYKIGGTGWTPASGCTYVDLTQAFNDLNNKAIIGAVSLVLTSSYSSTEDTFPVILNAIANSSSANTITIKPDAGIDVSITGTSTSALIKLNGSDYVTIDGSNNGSTIRNLTIANASTSATTTAVWLASVSSTNGATYNTIKNCNISAGSNTAATTYGINIGGTTTGSAGTNNDNNTIQNNAISKAYVGILATGTNGDMDTLNIIGNSIGAATGGTTSYIGYKGIEVSNTTNSNISQNTIYNIITSAYTPIGLSILSNVTNTNITKNNINNITFTGTGGYGARGIYISTAVTSSNLLIANNVIAVIGGDGYSSFSATSPVGLYIDGTMGGLNIYYNSIYMNGSLTYNGATITTAILFNTTTITSINLRNNVFVNSLNNTSNSTAKNYAIYSSTAATNFTQINYNDYYVSGSQGVLGYLGADVTTLGGWKTATSSDANSINSDPLFNSTTNLQPNNGSPLKNAGTYISTLPTDITGVTRSTSTPTIGAFENTADNSAPTISYTALANTSSTTARILTATITDASGVPTSGAGLPRIYWKKKYNGTYTGVASTFTGSDQYSFTFGSGVSAYDTVFYYIAAQDNYTTSNIGTSPSAGSAGFTSNPPAASTPPTSPSYYKIIGTLSAGNYNIGGTGTTPASGCTYVDLTAAFNDISNNVIQGAINLVLTSYYKSSEEDAFPIVINPVAGSSSANTVTIKPASSITDTISGSGTAILKLNGADYIIIDGSNNGTSSRNLFIINTSASSSTAAIWLASVSSTNGATYNTIKNCNISTGTNSTATTYGITITGTTIAAAGTNNDNNTIQNNAISKAYVGILATGTSGDMDTLKIIGNSIGATTGSTSSYIGFKGIEVSNTTNSNISQNTIYNIITTVNTPVGISILSNVVNTSITKNKINNITYTGSVGYGGRGMYISTSVTSSNLTIANNVIAVIGGDGYSSFSFSSPVGLYFDGTTGGLNIYHNSIYMNGTLIYNTATITTAILFYTTTITNIDLRNNVFVNTMNNTTNTSAKNYAIYSATAATNFTKIDYNDYYVSGSQGVLAYLGADITTLAGWKTATGKDSNSYNADPLFVSATDLHSGAGSLNNTGTPLSSVTTDIDGNSRSSSKPDIGAYEFALKPIAITGTKTSVTGTTATINGTINANNEGTTNILFRYGLTTIYSDSIAGTPSSATGLNNVNPTASLTALIPNSQYHYRIEGTNSVGTSYGVDSTFSTPTIKSVVTTDSANAITGASATIFGSVIAKNSSTTTIFEYGKTILYGTTVPAIQSPITGMTKTLVSASISGLEPNTTYHFRVKGTNLAGFSFANDLTFVTNSILPIATTFGASAITSTSAQLNGQANANNTSTAVSFEWGIDTNYGNTVTASQSPAIGLTAVAMSYVLTGLVPNTTYHYRIKATNTAGTVYGLDSNFKTPAVLPVAQTYGATNIIADNADLNGSVNAMNAITAVTFDVGFTTSYGIVMNAIPDSVIGTNNTVVTAKIFGLLPNTTYHYRVVATNIKGTTYGNDTFFITPIILPDVSTDPANAISASGATLNGTVNANNDTTSVTFEYGLTTTYGNSMSAVPNPVTGLNSIAVSYNLTGLDPNTMYHFRIVATNKAGTVYGNDDSFTTNIIPPTALTESATGITFDSATLNGKVNANNDTTDTYFEYGTTTSYGTVVSAIPSPVTGLSLTAVTYNLTGLVPNTLYHYRVYAVNTNGDTTFGGDSTFITAAKFATAIIGQATSITSDGATLNGFVNANNSATSVTFEFGTTTAYGQTFTATPATVTGTTATAVSYIITGWNHSTTYHYRIQAINGAGTIYSADTFFTTANILPTVTTVAATSITKSSAVSGGAITSDGGLPILSKGVCWSTTANPDISMSKTTDGTGTASFVSNITGLDPATLYYVRAYAENSLGVSYGNEIGFTTSPNSINEDGLAGKIRIYSANKIAYINIDSKVNINGYIQIFDLNGKRLTDTKIIGNSNQVDLSAYAEACYIVSVVANNRVYSTKIFIK